MIVEEIIYRKVSTIFGEFGKVVGYFRNLKRQLRGQIKGCLYHDTILLKFEYNVDNSYRIITHNGNVVFEGNKSQGWKYIPGAWEAELNAEYFKAVQS